MGRTRLASIAVLAAALVAVPGAAAPAIGAANLLASGGFEGSGNGTLAGWTGVRADLTLRPDGRGGGHAARVSRRPGARTYSIVAAPNPAVTVAERLYRAAGHLRSGRPGRTVCLKLLELNAAGRVVAQASACRAATYRWHALPVVSYRTRRTGDALALRIVQASAAASNHEYQTNGGCDCAPNAAGYFRYFGAAAGNAQGDDAWNIGTWHMIALNGECGDAGGCDAGSPQGTFLKANLGTSRCTLAYWHEPYDDGSGSRTSKYAWFWQTLYAAGADFVLNGHIHTYGRFARQDANGNVDSATGIRQFIVSTGGEDHGSLNGSVNVEATAKTFGVLEHLPRR